eukprot:TRINITY_DN4217_c0_g1_i1.p1 TRINITY_DN4217_c0_g1~~TRINITY_DN4217_c0_g1_i1.p1  ORF type:complete len:167 (+),score=43.28 TRINITY_DN4217_c0_g1_i1:162-662(+)
MHIHPDVPDLDPDTTVILFPAPDAIPISEIDTSTIKNVVFCDSTWQTTGRITNDPRIARLKKVVIPSRKTLFWRYQPEKRGDECLATIEAIYFFYRDFVEKSKGSYNGEVDNLLLFYVHQYNRIQEEYRKKQLPFVRIPNWVQPASSDGTADTAASAPATDQAEQS